MAPDVCVEIHSAGASMVEYDDGGEAAVVRGRVTDEAGVSVAGAIVDVWQNAAIGFYAVQQPYGVV